MSNVKRFQDNLKLIDELDNEVEDLYITSRFPPLTDVSGIVFSKRIMVANKKVDVVCSNFKGEFDNDFNKLIDNFIEDRIIVESDFAPNSISGINHFRQEGLKKLNELGKNYKNILSRAWTLESHFLALEYKLHNPDVVWTAEFSDPLSFNMDKKFKTNHPYPLDEEFLDKVNGMISKINEEEFGKDVDSYFPEVKSGDELYFLVEYLPFLIADVVRFTNPNQRELMMDLFPIDMRDFVFKKSEVITHPVLDSEFYFLKKSSYEIDPRYLNFAYFGTYIGKRHLEYIFKSFEELTDDIKDKIKLHMFVPNPDVLELNLNGLSIYDNIEIGDKLPFLEFLNLTTNVDVLIVNDSITKGIFDINPYLPSKVADYLGSGNDIWYLCEETSFMNTYDAKYKSHINDYESARDALEKIIQDKLGVEEVFDKALDSEYYQDRLTHLNNTIYDLYGQRTYWVNQTRLLKDQKNDSNSNNKRVNDLEVKVREMHHQITLKDERIDSLRQDCDLLIDDIHMKDDEIGSLKSDVSSRDDEISSLEKEHEVLSAEIQNRDETIFILSNEVDDFKKEVSSLKDQMQADNLEKDKLKEDYEGLHKLANESFDMVQVRDDTIASLEKENEILSADIHDMDDRIAALENKGKKLSEDIKIREDRISSLKNDYEALSESVQGKDERISSLERDYKTLSDDYKDKEDTISRMSVEVNDFKKEAASFRDQLESDYLEKTRLKEDYDSLQKLADDAFDVIQIKDGLIQDKDAELEYYRNHRGIFSRFVSSPLSDVYIVVTSSGEERDINRKLYDIIKNTGWFNVGFYLRENKDISKFKWVRLFSPQLHYVCHGFDEERSPNREGKVRLSKKELLDRLMSAYVDETNKES